MKSKGRAENDVVSLDNFDPTGPRDKPLDSPRTLQACKVVGVHPTELFLLDKKELAEQLGREDIEAVDQEAAYEEYVQEMQAIFDKLIAVRQEIIEKGISKKKGSKKTAGNKAKKDRSIRNYPEADELAGDDIGQLQEADLRGDEPSEGAAMNSKQLYKKKKPRKRLSNSVRPTKKMMEDFQRTQYLADMQQAAEQESSHRELTPMEKLQKVMEREQRRQKTMLQSYQNTEAKRQVLLQKMNEDLRRQHYYKNMKEEERVRRIISGMQKQARINEKLNYNKMLQMAKAQEAEYIRRQKEERANQMIAYNQLLKQAQFQKQEMDWSEKMNYINNLKDIEEFNRGMTSAMIDQKEHKFQDWLDERENLRQQQMLITQQIENQRLEIVADFERVKKDKERENMLMAEQIKSGKLDHLEQSQGNFSRTMPRRSTAHSSLTDDLRRRKRKTRAQNGQYSEKRLAKIIEEFNGKVETEIQTIAEQQMQAIEQLEDEAKDSNEKDRLKIEQQIAAIQQRTQETIEEIRKNQESDIRQLLESQGIELAN